MVVKMSKMAHFCMKISFANNQSVLAKCVSAPEISHVALLENAMDYWVVSYQYDANP